MVRRDANTTRFKGGGKEEDTDFAGYLGGKAGEFGWSTKEMATMIAFERGYIRLRTLNNEEKGGVTSIMVVRRLVEMPVGNCHRDLFLEPRDNDVGNGASARTQVPDLLPPVPRTHPYSHCEMPACTAG